MGPLHVVQPIGMKYYPAPGIPADVYVGPLQAVQPTGMKYDPASRVPADVYVGPLQAVQPTGMKYFIPVGCTVWSRGQYMSAGMLGAW